MSDDPIERLREHVEKNHHKGSAYFSIKGLSVLLDLLDTQERQFREFVERDDRIKLLDERVEAAKRFEQAAARAKKRATAGVCPCCHRTFRQMALHMRSKHPEFKAEEVAAANVRRGAEIDKLRAENKALSERDAEILLMRRG